MFLVRLKDLPYEIIIGTGVVVGDALEHPHAGQAHGRIVAAEQLGGAEHAGRRLPVVREPRLPGGDRRLDSPARACRCATRLRQMASGKAMIAATISP